MVESATEQLRRLLSGGRTKSLRCQPRFSNSPQCNSLSRRQDCQDQRASLRSPICHSSRKACVRLPGKAMPSISSSAMACSIFSRMACRNGQCSIRKQYQQSLHNILRCRQGCRQDRLPLRIAPYLVRRKLSLLTVSHLGLLRHRTVMAAICSESLI